MGAFYLKLRISESPPFSVNTGPGRTAQTISQQAALIHFDVEQEPTCRGIFNSTPMIRARSGEKSAYLGIREITVCLGWNETPASRFQLIMFMLQSHRNPLRGERSLMDGGGWTNSGKRPRRAAVVLICRAGNWILALHKSVSVNPVSCVFCHAFLSFSGTIKYISVTACEILSCCCRETFEALKLNHRKVESFQG